MPTPSTKRLLPQIAGTDTPDVPRDLNAVIAALENEVGYLTTRSILDVGQVGQTRAGRQLAPSDFTDMGLSAPLAIWNISDLSDASGNGANLTNKGNVTFVPGIEGIAASAGQFTANSTSFLYRADTGAANPLRIRQGTWGGWFKTAQRSAANGTIISKYTTGGGLASFTMIVNASNQVQTSVSLDGSNFITLVQSGGVDYLDDRFHFAVTTFDGEYIQLFIDGVQRGTAVAQGLIHQNASPVNIGGYGGDAGANASDRFNGRLDEVFMTSDVLSLEQIRQLYAVKLPHGLPRTPRRAGVTLRKRRRGAAIASGDFPTAPLRLHNFAGGGFADEGSQNQALAAAGSTTTSVGPSGQIANAIHFGTASYLQSPDTGLPSAGADRTLGCWYRLTGGAGGYMIAYGVATSGLDDGFSFRVAADGSLVIDTFTNNRLISGGGVANDGNWHFGVATYAGAPADGQRFKIYQDGKLLTSTVNGTISTPLKGTNGLKIGARQDGNAQWPGQISRAFICGYAMTCEQISALYAKGNQEFLVNRNSADYVEKFDANNVYVIGDGQPAQWDPQNRIDLEVAA